MSLILDALNRADQERSVENNTPGLQSAHYTAPANNHSLRRWALEALVVLAIIGGFYLYSQLDQVTAPPAVANTEAMAGSNPIVNNPGAAAGKPPVTISPVTISPTTSHLADKVAAVEVEDFQPQAGQIQAAQVAAFNVPASVPVTVGTNAAINSLYQRQPATTASSPPIARTNTPTNSQRVAKNAQPITATPSRQSDADKTQTILASIPLLSQHSLNFQQRIPSIEYSVHAYAEGGGFVMLNGKRYKVGDMLQPQLRVIAILPDSLVLDYQQKQFRLLALNSWINI
jgi:hypothetical protein